MKGSHSIAVVSVVKKAVVISSGSYPFSRNFMKTVHLNYSHLNMTEKYLFYKKFHNQTTLIKS